MSAYELFFTGKLQSDIFILFFVSNIYVVYSLTEMTRVKHSICKKIIKFKTSLHVHLSKQGHKQQCQIKPAA